MAFEPKSGMTNVTKQSAEKGYFVGAWGYETQIINSSGAYVGPILPSSVLLENGTAAAPSLAFASTGNTNTGIFLKATDSMGFSANGTEIASYSALGAWTFGASGGTQDHTMHGNSLTIQRTSTTARAQIFTASSGTPSLYLYASDTAGAGVAADIRFRGNNNTAGSQIQVGQIFQFSSSRNLARADVLSSTNTATAASGIYRIQVSGTTGSLLTGFSIAASGSNAVVSLGGAGTTPTHKIATNTETTVGAAGAASALPANPTGYIVIEINGTNRKIPFYAT